MNYGLIFALINISLSLVACIGYAVAHDWRRAIYWAAAAVLTGAVTYGK